MSCSRITQVLYPEGFVAVVNSLVPGPSLPRFQQGPSAPSPRPAALPQQRVSLQCLLSVGPGRNHSSSFPVPGNCLGIVPHELLSLGFFGFVFFLV